MNHVIDFFKDYGVVIAVMAIGWLATQAYLRRSIRKRG